jgi:hypothetical protein
MGYPSLPGEIKQEEVRYLRIMSAGLRNFLTAGVILAPLLASGQVEDPRCGTVYFNELIRSNNPNLPSVQEFEDWMEEKIRAKRSQRRKYYYSTTSATYTIPVVVHVIHNGEAVGSGTNIPLAQIQSQISVMNEDFKRMNTDAASTPAEFQSVAGSIDIEFVLAKTDPYGLATSGIIRKQGSKTSWTPADHYELASQSYWPAEEYLNIWVCNLSTLGYAQFPESNLPGLEGLSSTNRLTDGIVVRYNAFGSVDDGPFNLNVNFNKGRTATHELGHFFGLRHIWGDGSSCSATDYVSDTPPQIGNTDGCPSHPQAQCSANKMFQNYMDYTYDACMNLFTTGQFGRVQVVLENSPRRASLLTSPGSQPPNPTANDLGIAEIKNPTTSTCASTLLPKLRVVNSGSNTITSASLTVKLDGVTVLTTPFAMSLAPATFLDLTFGAVNLPTAGQHTLDFEIVSVNGVTDSKADNNTASVVTLLGAQGTIPINETFNLLPSSWTNLNPDGSVGWTTATANNGVAGNKSLYINNASYVSQGELDIFISPTFDLSAAPAATLSFERAYAPFPGENGDELRVLVQTDCQTSPMDGTEVFRKSGTALATRSATFNDYFPAGASDWVEEVISLNSFLGNPQVRVVFVARNGNSNNLFVDNVNIMGEVRDDVSIESVMAPSPVLCPGPHAPVISVKNLGTRPLSSVVLETSLGTETKSIVVALPDVLPGDSFTIQSEEIDFVDGTPQFSVSLSDPNGNADFNPADNAVSYSLVVDSQSDGIPLRKNFDAGITPGWTAVAPGAASEWETQLTNFSNSARFAGFSDPSVGSESWLVSPVLDFSGTDAASLFFDMAYSTNAPGYETLEVRTSADCGLTYTDVVYKKTAADLETVFQVPDFTPQDVSHWIREFVDLSDLAGQNNVRIAFVVTNGNGNNLYIDNIEFFRSNDPYPPAVDEPYQIYYDETLTYDFYITFNLPEKTDVRLRVFDVSGRRLLQETLDSSLNQTHPVKLLTAHTGLHIVTLQTGGQSYSTKVMIYR